MLDNYKNILDTAPCCLVTNVEHATYKYVTCYYQSMKSETWWNILSSLLVEESYFAIIDL